MTVYRYGLQFRPFSYGAVPDNFIPLPGCSSKIPDYSKPNKFGFMDYPAPLSDAEIATYELLPMGTEERNDGFTARCNRQIA